MYFRYIYINNDVFLMSAVHVKIGKHVRVMVFNPTFNVIPVTSLWAVLLMEETTDLP
jgi:hypothetical protein